MLVNGFLLSEERISSYNKARWAGRNLELHETIGSTNDRAKELARKGAPKGTLVLAEQQTGGKGRLGRKWETPAGSAIAMSLILRPEINPEKAAILTLVAALAQARAIRAVTGLTPQIKWPNDLVLSGKKVCGILTEMSAVPGGTEFVVVGIGVNCSMTEFPPEISDIATSITLESLSHENMDRNQLIAETMTQFESVYEMFLQTEDASLWKEEYEALLANKDAKVRILNPDQEETGIARGITLTGELVVEREDGSFTEVRSGEVSVRGIYGYV